MRKFDQKLAKMRKFHQKLTKMRDFHQKLAKMRVVQKNLKCSYLEKYLLSQFISSTRRKKSIIFGEGVFFCFLIWGLYEGHRRLTKFWVENYLGLFWSFWDFGQILTLKWPFFTHWGSNQKFQKIQSRDFYK